MIRKRDIAVSVVLSIITCGIYGIIWFIMLTDDVAYASEDNTMSGGMSFLLILITCGIYRFYWSYQMGKKMYNARVDRDMRATDNSVLYLILSILQLDIVNYCLIQSELNELDEA
ncbi:MAG: DUF4234 domain-containing protein [Bacilli bacterium]|nr:DUF4234 domain-containing protein [Bacilli bacterium]